MLCNLRSRGRHENPIDYSKYWDKVKTQYKVITSKCILVLDYIYDVSYLLPLVVVDNISNATTTLIFTWYRSKSDDEKQAFHAQSFKSQFNCNHAFNPSNVLFMSFLVQVIFIYLYLSILFILACWVLSQ